MHRGPTHSEYLIVVSNSVTILPETNMKQSDYRQKFQAYLTVKGTLKSDGMRMMEISSSHF